MSKTREERLAVRREWYQRNRQSILAKATEYRNANAEKIKERNAGKYAGWSAKYRAKNYEKCLAMTQAWKDANPERRRETKARWQKLNADRHRVHQHNRRTRTGANGGSLSPDIVQKLLILQKGRCACCSAQLGEVYELDHIVPLALGGENSDSNVQLLLSRCNRQKGAKPPIRFMQSRGRLL